jgi:hypothetical protein
MAHGDEDRQDDDHDDDLDQREAGRASGVRTLAQAHMRANDTGSYASNILCTSRPSA